MLAVNKIQTSRQGRMGKNRGYPQTPENRPKWYKNHSFFGFKPGFELPRPNAVEPWCRFADLSIFRDRDFWGPRHGQIPIHVQAFPSVGRPVMPSRRQLGPQGSVWRWLEAVEVPSGSKSLHFHVLGRRGNSASACLMLQSEYERMIMLWGKPHQEVIELHQRIMEA